jgi:serine-type D-Ala-D-Ala carboxypeptidase/endopeptidase (penicillin-binding protein 4)
MVLLGGCFPAVSPHRPASGAAALAVELASVFDDPHFAHAHWGVLIRSLETGETVVARNAERLFLPASNLKLLTGAAALTVLGPEFRYRTVIAAGGPINDGVLRGDLVVRGGGDPSISRRFHDDPRSVFRAWADSLRAHGVRRVAGAVVGMDEYLEPVPYGRGWAWDDLHHSYAAPVSSLQLDDSSIRLEAYPSREIGEPAIVSIDPPSAHIRLVNRVRTVQEGVSRIGFGYTPEGALLLTGRLPRDSLGASATIAVREPARFFMTVLRETLREAGIQVDGPALLLGEREHDEFVAARASPLFEHASAPLYAIVAELMKQSQNQLAEMVLRSLGRELRGIGSDAAGIAIVDSLVAAWGLPQGALLMADGSGLSRYNHASPELFVALLTQMTANPSWEHWYDALAIAGVDGTLRNRMAGTPAQGNVRAKTGTLTNTRALSGYVTAADGERIVFSMIVNAHRLTAQDADRIIDTALVRIAGSGRSAGRIEPAASGPARLAGSAP